MRLVSALTYRSSLFLVHITKVRSSRPLARHGLGRECKRTTRLTIYLISHFAQDHDQTLAKPQIRSFISIYRHNSTIHVSHNS